MATFQVPEAHKAFLTERPKVDWAKDADREACQLCTKSFSLFVRRHHCRRCGDIFCDSCSTHKMSFHYDTDGTGIFKGPTTLERVCDTCCKEGESMIEQGAGELASAEAEVAAAREVLAAAEAKAAKANQESQYLAHGARGHKVTILPRGGYVCSVCDGWKCPGCNADNAHTSTTCMHCHTLKPRGTSTSARAKHILTVSGLAASTRPGSEAFYEAKERSEAAAKEAVAENP